MSHIFAFAKLKRRLGTTQMKWSIRTTACPTELHCITHKFYRCETRKHFRPVESAFLWRDPWINFEHNYFPQLRREQQIWLKWSCLYCVLSTDFSTLQPWRRLVFLEAFPRRWFHPTIHSLIPTPTLWLAASPSVFRIRVASFLYLMPVLNHAHWVTCETGTVFSLQCQLHWPLGRYSFIQVTTPPDRKSRCNHFKCSFFRPGFPDQ